MLLRYLNSFYCEMRARKAQRIKAIQVKVSKKQADGEVAPRETSQEPSTEKLTEILVEMPAEKLAENLAEKMIEELLGAHREPRR